MRFTRLLLAWGLLQALAIPAAQAARTLGPPSKLLGADRNFVTVAVAVEEVAPGRFLFKKREDLVGAAPAEFEVRLVGVPAGEVKAGAQVVIGHSSYLRHARFPALKRDDPEGEKVIDLPGVGPALFEDSPQVRVLVVAPRMGSRTVLDAILRQLARPDRQARRLAVFELYFRPELRPVFTLPDAEMVQTALADPALEPLSRDFLLRAAARLPDPVRGHWVPVAARAALADPPAGPAGADLDLGSPVPALASTALGILQRSGGPGDTLLAARFLSSNSTGVVQAALDALSRLAPQEAIPRAEDALMHAGLTPEVRTLLEGFVQRKTAAPRSAPASGAAADRAPPVAPEGPAPPRHSASPSPTRSPVPSSLPLVSLKPRPLNQGDRLVAVPPYFEEIC
jgi:hypothetical protein